MRYTKQQRRGLLILAVAIGSLQAVYMFGFRSTSKLNNKGLTVLEKALERRIDSLQNISKQKKAYAPYTFNPNFISEYRGYLLGLSLEELTRLKRYRDQGLYVNSKEDFQRVTGVSDSLLSKLAPLFKFPDFVKANPYLHKPVKLVQKKDLNKASQKDLVAVYGIGEVRSKRIIEYRDKLGGFVLGAQLYEVFGLSKESADAVLQKFAVLSMPDIKKVNLNKAHLNQLSKIPYMDYELAQKLLAYRTRFAKISSLEDLFDELKIPAERAALIAHYVTLE